VRHGDISVDRQQERSQHRAREITNKQRDVGANSEVVLADVLDRVGR
jgi:hypothetical protein